VFNVTVHFEVPSGDVVSEKIGSALNKVEAVVQMHQNAYAWHGASFELHPDGNVYRVYVNDKLDTTEWYSIEKV
jgi:hypothetical protein